MSTKELRTRFVRGRFGTGGRCGSCFPSCLRQRAVAGPIAAGPRREHDAARGRVAVVQQYNEPLQLRDYPAHDPEPDRLLAKVDCATTYGTDHGSSELTPALGRAQRFEEITAARVLAGPVAKRS